MTVEGKATVERLIKCDIDSAWEAIKGFGAWAWAWSEAFIQVELDGEDEVGVLRTLTAVNGNVIEERLLSRDEGEHSMVYSLVSRKWKNGLLKATTTIHLESESSATLASFNCDFEAIDECSAKAIKCVFESSTFKAALSGLEDHLDPAVAEISIRRITADLDMPDRESKPDTFVRVWIKDCDGSIQEIGTTEIARDVTKPMWHDSFSWDVRKNASVVEFTVFERVGININELVFGCELSIEDIKSKGTGQVFEIPSRNEDGSQKIQCKIVFKELQDDDLIVSNEEKVLINPTTQTEAAVKFAALMHKMQSYFYENVMRGDDGPAQLEYMLCKDFAKFGIDPTHLPGTYKHLPTRYKKEPEIFGIMFNGMMKAYFSFGEFCKNRMDGKSKWTAFFSDVHFPMPPPVRSLVEGWQSDYEFCRQFLQGINPFLIRMVEDISEIPEDMRDLQEDDDTQSVPDLIAEKRLFIVDYVDLVGLTKPQAAGHYRSSVWKQSKNVFYAPYVLLYRTTPESTTHHALHHNLKPLGIQLTRLEEGNKVFTPSTNEKTPASTDLQWLYAKILVNNSDAIVMEFVNHLGIGHLALEPVVIAYYNMASSPDYDPKNKVIVEMLKPHMAKTLAVNDLARHTLTAKKEATTDFLISSGTFFGVKAFAKKYRTLDYSDFCFPQQTGKRGFDRDGSDGIVGYYYRDDGYMMWDALYQYAEKAVNFSYETDEDVIENSELQKFFSEMCSSEKGNFLPFRNLAVDSKEKLTEALACIIFQATAFHAVQNNAQFDYCGFVPNKPLAVKYQDIEDPDLTMEKIYESLPDQQLMLKQMVLTYCLASPVPELTMNSLHALQFIIQEAHEGLMADFAKLEAHILERSIDCEEIPYQYFQPSVCNQSVNM